MCPLYPLHIILGYALLLLGIWVVGGTTIVAALDSSLPLNVRLAVNDSVFDILDVNEGEVKEVSLYLDDLSPEVVGDLLVKEQSEDGLSHIEFSPDKFRLNYNHTTQSFQEEAFNVSGSFLGFSKMKFVLSSAEDEKEYMESSPLPVKVHRQNRTLDIIFIHVVILLVLIAFINMGCAIDVEVVKDNFRRPVAPAIGLASQYLFMPIFAYGLGYVLFSSTPELWLGLFFSGCAPGGGGSNMWTYILGGSLDLSITMTFLSTLFAFAALPLWTYALAPTIYAEGHFGRLPYRNIAALVFGLVIPVGIGLIIRRCCPKAADFLKKMLKPLSIVFIVFIMTFGVYANFYLFSFFTWKVAVAGFCLPFFGFGFGFLIAILMNRKYEDVIAISVETGVQNTGLAIGVLKIALEEFNPLGDIAIVMPVAVAMMTPLPLFVALIVKYIRGRRAWNKQLGEKMEINNDGLHGVTYTTDNNENSKKMDQYFS